jgi:hypothetical protein
MKFPYSRHIYIINKRYSEGIRVWRARISNQTGFKGEYYANGWEGIGKYVPRVD